MPNPPKFDPQRGARGRGITLLPAGGREGAPPLWPGPGAATLAEQDRWARLWTTPQAVAWERMGEGTHLEVARYVRLLVAAEDPEAKPATHAQATALADRLGLTPKSMRLLLWQITPDEVAERREARPNPRSARGRIKAVDAG
jgi:hypothetical protein